MNDHRCPCGGGAYATCCAPFHSGERRPETAEALMRSRFSAYSRGEYGYLATTHVGLSPADALAIAQDARGVRWSRLEVRAVEGGGAEDDEGTVEFVAHSRRAGRAQRLHEVSRFRRIDGRWMYVDGEIKAAGRSRKRRR